MSYIEIFLLAVSLCFDTLAISIVGGACMSRISLGQHVKISGSFALVQGLFIVIGWALGSSVLTYISAVDHWVAFGLLLFIGGKMLIDTFRGSDDEESVDLLDTPRLLLSSVATSIDALAVGISMAMLDFSVAKIAWTFLIVVAVTAAAAQVGLRGGQKAAKLLGSKASIVGGIILIAIGVKILVEHIAV